ncbi:MULTISPECIES: hypothetical protein [Nocardia]|uniref:hypothetical protein n=1 Tax=Nocardia TaxID=1817 RepID=UPI001895E1A2|nr:MULTISPECIES: hypothetical protein [Nocardia]MBF6351353.1 hypothetical protein [Nocardia flavorosea]
MIDTDDPDDVIAAGGRFTTEITSTTGDVGRIVDDMVVHSKAGSPLDRALVEKLTWVQGTFENAVRDTEGQARTTLDATVLGATVLANADIDGSVVVRRAEV